MLFFLIKISESITYSIEICLKFMGKMVEFYNGINERHFGIRDWWQPKNLENGQFEKNHKINMFKFTPN